jgi:hypothetical protein
MRGSWETVDFTAARAALCVRRAQVAAQLLDVVAYEDHNFLTASVPVPRLLPHVGRSGSSLSRARAD